MSEHSITVQGGSSVRLLTAGKYCDRDILVTAEGGGTDGAMDALVDKSITEYSSDSITSIGDYAFHSCKELVNIDFPNVVTVGINAFNKCTKIETANFPMLKTISQQAFYACTKMRSFNAPNVEIVGANAFNNCNSLIQ